MADCRERMGWVGAGGRATPKMLVETWRVHRSGRGGGLELDGGEDPGEAGDRKRKVGESLGEAGALVPGGQVVLALIVSRCVLALVVPRWVPALAVEGEDPRGKGRGEVPVEAGDRRKERAPVKLGLWGWKVGKSQGGLEPLAEALAPLNPKPQSRGPRRWRQEASKIHWRLGGGDWVVEIGGGQGRMMGESLGEAGALVSGARWTWP